jgi:hypothetical protein
MSDINIELQIESKQFETEVEIDSTNFEATVEIDGKIISYNEMINKPKINGVLLVGDKTSEDLGIEAITIEELEEMLHGK